MNKLTKLVSLLLCLCMLMGTAALAEETAVEPEASAVTEIAADAVVAKLNAEDILWADVEAMYNNLISYYGSYYDMTQQENVDLFRAVAVENVIIEKLLGQKAVEFGMNELTAEEVALVEAQVNEEWDAAMASYVEYFYPDLTEESSDDEKAAARAEAEKYYLEAGYSLDVMLEENKDYAVLEKVQNMMVQDASVTDAEVEELYQSLVAADKELYENDIAAYLEYENTVDMMAMYAAMYGSASEYEHAWYKPNGFRAVKHILLPVDETLMSTYTDLQARLEEQLSDEAIEEATEEAAEEATEEAAEEPVTEEMVNEAKAAIFASLAEKIDEINAKIAEGADFDELIAAYGVNADGTPSDPGMASGDSAVNGYEVAAESTSVYVPEFVEAAMSIAEVGGVSAPYLSTFGIHIVKYIGDVAGGPIEMTEAERETKRADLLYDKQNELYNATIDSWLAESTVEYTGVVPSFAQLEAEQAADAAAE